MITKSHNEFRLLESPSMSCLSILPATLLLALVAGVPALAQEPNTSGSMTLNGIETGVYPIDAPLLTPATLVFAISGSPTSAGQPFALFVSSDVVTPGLPVAGEFVDIDIPSLSVVMDGTNPGATPFNNFAFMGGAGSSTLSLPVTSQIPSPTLVGGFQALIFDPSAPLGFNLTAATRLTLHPPPNLGTVHYGRGASPSRHTAYSLSVPGGATLNPAMPLDHWLLDIDLAGFQPALFHATRSHPWRRKDFASLPAGTTAMRVYEGTSFRYIKTKHGDLYLFRDNGPNPNEGFTLAGASGPIPLAATMVSTVNTWSGTASEIVDEVGVHENRFAYVLDPDQAATPNTDRVILASLDGPTLSGGLTVVDLTPTSPVIAAIFASSLTFTTSNLFFLGNSIALGASGIDVLFSAPNDGSAISTQVAIPPVLDAMGMPVVPTVIDSLMRYSEDRSMFVFQAGASTSNEDLYAVQDSGPGLYAPINLTMFSTPIEIEEFYDSSSGIGNQVAISPNNLRVAFVTRENNSDELYVVDLAAPGVLTHVSNPANMNASWDETIELHWATDDTLVFWAGPGLSNNFELCAYTLSTGIIQNITQTSGSTTLPLNGVPNIDVRRIFYSPSRSHLFWERDDGTDGLGNPTMNWIALDLATLALTDITGNEFSNGTAPHCDSSSGEIQYARSSDTLVFTARNPVNFMENVYAFTGGPVPTPAIPLTNNLGTGNFQSPNIRSVSVNDNGSTVAFADTTSGRELLYRADTTVANSATVAYAPPPAVVTANLTKGSIIWTGVDQFLFAYGSSRDFSTLFVHDGILGNLILDTTLASYWIY